MIETAAAVASILSAFTASAGLVRKLQQRREDRKKGKLQRKLEDSAKDVDQEYHLEVRRLGRRFEVGDGQYSL